APNVHACGARTEGTAGRSSGGPTGTACAATKHMADSSSAPAPDLNALTSVHRRYGVVAPRRGDAVGLSDHQRGERTQPGSECDGLFHEGQVVSRQLRPPAWHALRDELRRPRIVEAAVARPRRQHDGRGALREPLEV